MNQPPPSTTGPVSAATATAREWWPDAARTLVWDTLQTAEDDETTDIVERGDRILAALQPLAALQQHLILRQPLLDLAAMWEGQAAACPGALRSFNLEDCAAQLRALAEVRA